MLRQFAAQSMTYGRTFLGIFFAVTVLSGCISATPYLDASVKDITPTEMKKVGQPKPVQLFFEFQTKGSANGAATQMLQKQVTDQVVASGLFSSVDTKPVTGGATVSVVINNVPADDAFKKGFGAGLTFGLVGTSVTDAYVCTVTYRVGSAAPVVKTTKHAIYTTVGNASAPPNAVKYENLDLAARAMARQIVGNALKELSFDPALN